MSSSPLRLFAGRVVRRGDPDYALHRYQYATTSVDPTTMAPAMILVPRDTDDVLRALEYADQHDLAVAIRTGGHQLSGASSTAGDNILLDLRHTWPHTTFHEDEGLVEAGVSQHLGAFHGHLARRGLFLPHGQCQHVMLGGHVQTGGSGMLARAFGLLSDHVERFELMTCPWAAAHHRGWIRPWARPPYRSGPLRPPPCPSGHVSQALRTRLRRYAVPRCRFLLTVDGRLRMIHRDATDPDERDLYWATLGGSPGSFGILTRVFFRPLRDADHPNSRGLKFLVPYSKERLHRVLDVMAELTADDALAADHDLTVTVLGAPQLNAPWPNGKGLDERFRTRHPEHYGKDGHRLLPQALIVYGQWSDVSGRRFDPTLFDRIKRAAGYGRTNGLLATAFEAALNRIRLDGSPLGLSPERPTPISRLTAAWMFLNVREYALPYVKRVYLSNRTDLDQTGWAEHTAAHFDTMVRHPHMKPLLQAQHQGGRFSRYRTQHGDDLTAHSWRSDTTLVALVDCFHPDEGPGPTSARREAEAWQRESDRIFLGEQRFATEDRRFAWGSYGDTDLTRVAPHYIEGQDRLARLVAIKRRVDAKGRFSANAFALRLSV